VVAIVVEVLQAVTELRVLNVHHLLESDLNAIGKVVLTRRNLVRSAAKGGNRAEAVRSRICWIYGTSVVARG
jgi:hypothetical protein